MKSKIYLVFCLIILLVFTMVYFYKTEEAEQKFERPEKAFIVSYYSVVERYNVGPLFNINRIKNLDEKKKFDEDLREKIIELLNMPLEEIPISEIAGSEINVVDKGKYLQKKISILTSKNTAATAYLLIPKNVEFPAPAIIAMHQHGGNYEYGKDEPAGNIGNPELFYGKELAERGYIVWIMDSFLFGDRNFKSSNSNEVVEILVSQRLFNLGHPPLGLIVQEDLVSLDFIYSLDMVDKENIGCIGHSFGGVRCMYLSALDKRVKATVLSSSVGRMDLELDAGITYSWLNILPGFGKYTSISGILALIEPRPVMILYTEKDPIFRAQDAQNSINEVRRIYNLEGKEKNLVSLFIPGTAHTFPIQVHEKTYEFLDKHLKKQ